MIEFRSMRKQNGELKYCRMKLDICKGVILPHTACVIFNSKHLPNWGGWLTAILLMITDATLKQFLKQEITRWKQRFPAKWNRVWVEVLSLINTIFRWEPDSQLNRLYESRVANILKMCVWEGNRKLNPTAKYVISSKWWMTRFLVSSDVLLYVSIHQRICTLKQGIKTFWSESLSKKLSAFRIPSFS